MKRLAILFCLLPLALALAQAPQTLPAPSVPATPPAQTAAAEEAGDYRRIVYESVVHYQGKPIGTSILLQIARDGNVSGWIQRNDFFPIDSGKADAERIRFDSGGNSYDINLRTDRVNYSGPDGKGNQRVDKMSYVKGLWYRITEPAEESMSILTIRNEDGDRDYRIGEPSIWKRASTPIDRLEFERYKGILGKTTGVFLSSYGASKYIAVVVEPEGMDIQKKLPKDKKKKKK